MSIVICGRGRLGTLIAESMQAQGQQPNFMRIAADRGLFSGDGDMPSSIDLLLLCLVPKAAPDETESPWLHLLDGVLKQIQSGRLTIGHVMHISSTGVFAGAASGWCDGSTTLTAINARVRGLLAAEAHVRQMSTNSKILRLPGLIGPGYERYEPASMSTGQIRHAVDIRAAARIVSGLAKQKWHGHSIDVVSDGHIYFQNHKAPYQSHPQLPLLLQQTQVLRPDHIANWP